MGQTRCQLGGSHQERLRGMSWLVAPVRSFLNPARHPWVRTWPDPTAETGRDLGVFIAALGTRARTILNGPIPEQEPAAQSWELGRPS